jgi:hypothetical protein
MRYRDGEGSFATARDRQSAFDSTVDQVGRASSAVGKPSFGRSAFDARIGLDRLRVVR